MENQVIIKEEKNKEGKLNTILFSLLMLVLGIFLIIATDDILTASNYVFVCIFAFIGVIQFINFLIGKDSIYRKRENLTMSIVFIWLAMVMYVYYTMLILVLPIIFSLYLLVIGSDLIIKYITVKKELDIRNYVNLVLGLITLLIGVLLVFKPIWGIYTYLNITGVNIILISLLSLFDLVKNIRVSKNNG